ncbi:MAG: Flp family type IVb pilin [Candidatus Eremiobacteraeota bacterium]|nr:Flp family type IVb pilin [Candidatus Eremiobacteraeota bacterium]
MNLAALLRDEEGATLTEYGLLMASFSILSIGGLLAVASAANAVLQSIFSGTTAMQQCPPGTAGC